MDALILAIAEVDCKVKSRLQWQIVVMSELHYNSEVLPDLLGRASMIET